MHAHKDQPNDLYSYFNNPNPRLYAAVNMALDFMPAKIDDVLATYKTLTLTLKGCSAPQAVFNESQLQYLARHIGTDSTFSHKKVLIDYLKIIYSALTSNDITDDHKNSIIGKINENIDQCSPGYFDRVSDVIESLYAPKTIDELLAKYRADVVRQAASQHGATDVHANNDYCCVAHTMGLNIAAGNLNDAYSGNISREVIETHLIQAFNRFYTPQYIVENLLSILLTLPGQDKIDYLNNLNDFFVQETSQSLITSNPDHLQNITNYLSVPDKMSLLIALSNDELAELSKDFPNVSDVLSQINAEQLRDILYADNAETIYPIASQLLQEIYCQKHPQKEIQGLTGKEKSAFLNDFMGLTRCAQSQKIMSAFDRVFQGENNPIVKKLNVLLSLIDKKLDIWLQLLKKHDKCSYINFIMEQSNRSIPLRISEQGTIDVHRYFIIQEQEIIIHWGHLKADLIRYFENHQYFSQQVDKTIEKTVALTNGDMTIKMALNLKDLGSSKIQFTYTSQPTNAEQYADEITCYLGDMSLQFFSDLTSQDITLLKKIILTHVLNHSDHLQKNDIHVDWLRNMMTLSKVFANDNPLRKLKERSLHLLYKKVEKNGWLTGINDTKQLSCLSYDANTDETAILSLIRPYIATPEDFFPFFECVSAKNKFDLITTFTNDVIRDILAYSIENKLKITAKLCRMLSILNRNNIKDILIKMNQSGQNALMLAVRHQPEAVKPLLDAILSLKDKQAQSEILTQTIQDGWNALMIAVRYQPEAVKPLIDIILSLTDKQDQGKILAQISQDGWNALMLAVQYQPAVVKLLLDAILSLKDKQAQIKILTQVNKVGFNALMSAAYEGKTEIVTLLSTDIDPNLSTEYGITALFLAAQNGHIDTVRELLRHSTHHTKHIFSTNEKSLLNFSKNKSEDIQQRLKAWIDKQSNKEDLKMSPTEIAIIMGYQKIADLITEHHAQLMHSDSSKKNDVTMQPEYATEMEKLANNPFCLLGQNQSRLSQWRNEDHEKAEQNKMVNHPKFDN